MIDFIVVALILVPVAYLISYLEYKMVGYRSAQELNMTVDGSWKNNQPFASRPLIPWIAKLIGAHKGHIAAGYSAQGIYGNSPQFSGLRHLCVVNNHLDNYWVLACGGPGFVRWTLLKMFSIWLALCGFAYFSLTLQLPYLALVTFAGLYALQFIYDNVSFHWEIATLGFFLGGIISDNWIVAVVAAVIGTLNRDSFIYYLWLLGCLVGAGYAREYFVFYGLAILVPYVLVSVMTRKVKRNAETPFLMIPVWWKHMIGTYRDKSLFRSRIFNEYHLALLFLVGIISLGVYSMFYPANLAVTAISAFMMVYSLAVCIPGYPREVRLFYPAMYGIIPTMTYLLMN